MLEQNNSVFMMVQANAICSRASNSLRTTLKETKELQSNWAYEAWLRRSPFWVCIPSPHYRERQPCSLYGHTSLVAGLQDHATLYTPCYIRKTLAHWWQYHAESHGSAATLPISVASTFIQTPYSCFRSTGKEHTMPLKSPKMGFLQSGLYGTKQSWDLAVIF